MCIYVCGDGGKREGGREGEGGQYLASSLVILHCGFEKRVSTFTPAHSAKLALQPGFGICMSPPILLRDYKHPTPHLAVYFRYQGQIQVIILVCPDFLNLEFQS